MQILFCDTLLSVRLIYYLKTIINVLKFIVPMLLIIKVTFDFYKGVINPNNEKQELIKKSSTRIIAAVIIFLVPTFISILFSFIESYNKENYYKTNFLSCYNNVNSELIKKLVIEQENKITKEEQKKITDTLIAYAKYEAERQNMIEASKKANTNSGNSSGSSGGSSTGSGSGSGSSNTSTYSSNLTDNNKQNGVYVKNGVFYKPKYKSGDPSTYSGKNCPTNPLSQGYNNKYGYNNHFYTMLENLINGAKKAGYNLKISSTGCRKYSTQESFYKKMESGRAAKPGKSNHGWGIASDVTFYKNSTTKCGSSRTRSNCPGMAWVHDHAKDYGLKFPLLNASYKEDWHIEPMNLKTY